MCTTSVVVALYGTTGAAAAAGTVVGFILKGRLDAAGTPMLRETGSATGDGTENSDQAQTLPSLYACSPPLSSTCPLPSSSPPASRVGRTGRGKGKRSCFYLLLFSAFHFLAPPLPPSPTPRPRTPTTRLCDRAPHSSPLFSLLFLFSSFRFVRLASPRLAAPLDSFSVGRVVLSTDAAGIADIPALRSRSSMDAGRVPRVPVGRCR